MGRVSIRGRLKTPTDSNCNLFSMYGAAFWCSLTRTTWWDLVILQTCNDQQWLQNFCIRKQTFLEQYEEFALTQLHQNTWLREAIPLQMWIAITLCKLTTPICYISMASQFGVVKSIVGFVVMEVCQVIPTVMYPCMVGIRHVPETIASFQRMGFPSCGEVIDGHMCP